MFFCDDCNSFACNHVDPLKCGNCEKEFSVGDIAPNSIICHPCKTGTDVNYEWIEFKREEQNG